MTKMSRIYPIEEFGFKKKFVYDATSNNRTDAVKVGLSLDGGGMRGLLLASQLHYLC